MASATATTTATETLTLPVEEPSSVSEAWNTAQRRFLEDLTPEERDVFRNASLQSVLQEVEAADVAHKSSR